jgi:hypothetical protein
MFSFSKKSDAFFIEINDETALMARTSSSNAPFVIEETKEVPVGDEAAVQQAVKELVGKRSGSAYMHARCGIYPPRRLIRRMSVDLKRVKEPAYFHEVCTEQFRIETEKYTIAVLNSVDGTDFETAKATTQKDAIFVGAHNDELLAAQQHLLELGVFPERLELGTVATLGALADFHSFAELKTPTLVLEMETSSTQSFIITAGGLDVSRTIPAGFEAMTSVVQKELNLKDVESARKLFLSNTFDFTNMGGLLIRKLLKELQSLIGFYEVQTGQSIGQVFCPQLPSKLLWLGNVIAKEIGVEPLKLDFANWLKARGITFASPTASSDFGPKWLGLFSLMLYYDAVAATKK